MDTFVHLICYCRVMMRNDDNIPGVWTRLEIFYPAWERSAHIAVGQVIITTCTVSTLSHTWTIDEDTRTIVML